MIYLKRTPRLPSGWRLVCFLTIWSGWLCACSKSDPHSHHKPTPAVDPDRLPTDTRAVHAAMQTPLKRILKLYPTFNYKASSLLRIRLGDRQVDTLAETYRLQRTAGDVFYGLHKNSKERGYEFYWKDSTFYFHNLYRPLQFRRAGRPRMHAEAKKIWALLADYWYLLKRFVKLKKGKKTQLFDRKVWSFALTSRKKPRPWTRPRYPRRAWRKTLRVESLAGRVMLDCKTAVPLAAELKAVYSHPTDSARRARVALELTHRIDPRGTKKPITIPKAIPAPVRRRPELDRRALLKNTPRPGWYRGGGPVRAWRRKRARRHRPKRKRKTPRR